MIGQLVKLTNESAVHLADVARLKVARRGNAFFDERHKEVFINGLPITICSGARMFWSRKLKAHLTELSQYFDSLLDQQYRQVEKIVVEPSGVRGQERLRCRAVVTTVEGTDEATISSQSKSA